MYLSKMLGGRCVAVCLSREETFVNSRTRHAMDMFSALKVDDTGKIVKKALRLHSNGGAYAGHGHAVSAYAVTNFSRSIREAVSRLASLPLPAQTCLWRRQCGAMEYLSWRLLWNPKWMILHGGMAGTCGIP